MSVKNVMASSLAAMTMLAAADAMAQSAKPEAKKSAPAKWADYKGKSFKVEFPPGWKVQTLEAKKPRESDAATFTSPDGAMQFYIFSPQWDGTPPAIALDEGETFAIRAVPRRHVVSPFKGHALRSAAGNRNPVDLRATAAIGGEQDGLPIRRKIRLGINRRTLRQTNR